MRLLKFLLKIRLYFKCDFTDLMQLWRASGRDGGFFFWSCVTAECVEQIRPGRSDVGWCLQLNEILRKRFATTTTCKITSCFWMFARPPTLAVCQTHPSLSFTNVHHCSSLIVDVYDWTHSWYYVHLFQINWVFDAGLVLLVGSHCTCFIMHYNTSFCHLGDRD